MEKLMQQEEQKEQEEVAYIAQVQGQPMAQDLIIQEEQKQDAMIGAAIDLARKSVFGIEQLSEGSMSFLAKHCVLQDLYNSKDAFASKYTHLKKPTGVDGFDVKTLATARIDVVVDGAAAMALAGEKSERRVAKTPT